MYIRNLDRPIHHTATKGVWAKARLDIGPMLYSLAVFKPKDFKADPATGKVLFRMGEHIFPILKRTDNIHVRTSL